MVYDSMNGVQGPYARRVFVDELGAPEFSGSNCSQQCQEGMSRVAMQKLKRTGAQRWQTRALAVVFHCFISSVFDGNLSMRIQASHFSSHFWPRSVLMNAVPKEDFGGKDTPSHGHADPNLTYAVELVQKMGTNKTGRAEGSPV